jgi:hypothetical protein
MSVINTNADLIRTVSPFGSALRAISADSGQAFLSLVDGNIYRQLTGSIRQGRVYTSFGQRRIVIAHHDNGVLRTTHFSITLLGGVISSLVNRFQSQERFSREAYDRTDFVMRESLAILCQDFATRLAETDRRMSLVSRVFAWLFYPFTNEVRGKFDLIPRGIVVEGNWPLPAQICRAALLLRSCTMRQIRALKTARRDVELTIEAGYFLGRRCILSAQSMFSLAKRMRSQLNSDLDRTVVRISRVRR